MRVEWSNELAGVVAPGNLCIVAAQGAGPRLHQNPQLLFLKNYDLYIDAGKLFPFSQNSAAFVLFFLMVPTLALQQIISSHSFEVLSKVKHRFFWSVKVVYISTAK
jgi:hypothetical protein